MSYIKCNICRSSKYQLLFKGKDRLHRVDNTLFNVVKCSNCGLVYLNPQPNQKELIKYYPKNYGPYKNINDVKFGFFSRNLKKIIKKINQNNRRIKPIESSAVNYLDFGCGGGINLEGVKKLHPNWNLYGLDNNEFACKKTREKGFEVFCGDILEINLPKNFFDIVNMSHVIEHLNHPRKILEKINSSIKSGGNLIVSTPNFNSLEAKLFKNYWYALDVPRHLFFFTPETIKILLSKVGFKINNVKYEIKPEIIIKSFYYIIGKEDIRVNPFNWRFFYPVNIILSLFHKSSVMTINAKKVRDIFKLNKSI